MKLLLKSLAVVLGLIIVAVLAFLFLFDPNVFKPRIEELAREHNVALQINGDMGWQLWPALAIEINDVQATSVKAPEQAIARLGRASLRLAIAPLFRGEVAVDHVIIDGAIIDLVVDQQGRGNWEALLPGEQPEGPAPTTTIPATTEPSTTEPTAAEPDTAPAESAELNLAVERISIHNSALSYTSYQVVDPAVSDAPAGEPQRFTLQDIQLDIENLNLKAVPFSVALQWRSSLTDAALFGSETVTITGSLQQAVSVTKTMDAIDIKDGRLQLAINGHGASTDLLFTYHASVSDLQKDLRYQGKVELAPVNVKQVLAALGQEAPATTEGYALTEISLSTPFSGTSSAIVLDPFTLTVDRTQFTGRVAVTDFATTALELALEGTSLNVDHYLPPADPQATKAETVSSGDEEIIPLETIRALNAKVNVGLEQVTASGMTIEDIRLRVNAGKGLVTIEQASAQAYDGTVDARGSLDARGKTAVIDFKADVETVQLAQLMRDQGLEQDIELKGAINAKAAGTTRGVSINQLMNNAKADASFSGAEVRLAPLNIEQQFCQIVDLVSKDAEISPDHIWQSFTEMTALSGTANFKNNVLTIEQAEAGVVNLIAGAKGSINLGKGTYDLGLPLTLTENTTSPDGCRIKSNYWLDRTLSLLRCRGSLESMSPLSDCRPDPDGLKELVKDVAAYQIKKKHGEKIDAFKKKLNDKTSKFRNKLMEKFGGGETDDNAETDGTENEGTNEDDNAFKRLFGR